MKPSTSTTSLTALDEKGCIICTESEGETGEALVDSKLFTQCKCSFRVHRTCWETRVMESEEKLCPSCNKTVFSPSMFYPSISIERGYGRGNMSYSNWHIVYILLFLMVVIVIIITGFELKWFKKEN